MRIPLLPLCLLLIAANDPPAIQITHPWARATAGASKNGAAYMTITDQGAPDRLTGVSSPVADMVQLHQTSDDHGTMRMRAVDGGLTLTPGQPVTLAPGGYHIMMMGLKAPLTAGSSFPVTLTFAHAAPLTVTVQVEAAGGAMDHMHH